MPSHHRRTPCGSKATPVNGEPPGATPEGSESRCAREESVGTLPPNAVAVNETPSTPRYLYTRADLEDALSEYLIWVMHYKAELERGRDNVLDRGIEVLTDIVEGDRRRAQPDAWARRFHMVGEALLTVMLKRRAGRDATWAQWDKISPGWDRLDRRRVQKRRAGQRSA